MKKIFTGLLLIGVLIFSVVSTGFAKSDSTEENLAYIIEMQEHLSESEVIIQIMKVMKSLDRSFDNVVHEIANELRTDIELGIKEQTVDPQGGSAGNYRLDPGTKGDIYYTDAYTGAGDINVNHGHVGIYYSAYTIVESVPGDGVRRLDIGDRRVHYGSVQQNTPTISQATSNEAANWANSRVDVDNYSYNFATNRHTSHYGAKNCSKLVWSAYMLQGYDIDKDKGLGVYPRDIRDSSYTSTYNTIN